ncbi:MAG: hypothetical protein M3437_16515 [Chloroflexota bacterium]|nr:hypothetical protein [Chloroflexota bacterium]MDQ5865039.1 hypothetical protein [Chloroflexota bacterium]
MFSKELLIPVAGLLVFVVAVVGLLFGERLGWMDMLGRIPPLVILALVGGALLVGWRMRPGRSIGNLGNNIWMALFIFSVLVLLWQAISYFQAQ